MSKCRGWVVLVSVGALMSACQLGLDGRACSISDAADVGECSEGWSCCADDTCQRDCSDEGEESSAPGGSNETASHDDNPAATSVQADVGPDGGELVLGGASLHIPPGALTESTALELSTTALPLPLPPARQQTSDVYRLSAAPISFAEPVTLDVPVDASSSQHMMVLELGDVGWEPVLGARFNAEGVAESQQGTVSWSTRSGRTFVVVVVENQSSMQVVLGDTPYSYACDGSGLNSISTVDDNGGMGPAFSTQGANSSACPWPVYQIGLWLDVQFRNFRPSDGLAVGTWDLAAPESILPLRVEFIASVEFELPVGEQPPYQYYDSTTPVEGAEGPIPDVTFQGFYQSPLASGSISVLRLPTVANTGYSSEAEYLGTDSSLYSIELSNVTLGATTRAVPNPESPFPPTVSITSATLTYAL